MDSSFHVLMKDAIALHEKELNDLSTKVDSWRAKFELLQKQKHRYQEDNHSLKEKNERLTEENERLREKIGQEGKSCFMCDRLQKMMDDMKATYKESLQVKEKYIQNLEFQLANTSISTTRISSRGEDEHITRNSRTPMKETTKALQSSSVGKRQSPDSTCRITPNKDDEDLVLDTSPEPKAAAANRSAKLRLGRRPNKRNRYTEDPSPENKRQKVADKQQKESRQINAKGKTSRKQKAKPFEPEQYDKSIVVPETCDPYLIEEPDGADITHIDAMDAGCDHVVNVPETVAVDTESSEVDSENDSVCTVKENSQVREYSLRSVLCSPMSSTSEDDAFKLPDVGPSSENSQGQNNVQMKPSMKKSESLPEKTEERRMTAQQRKFSSSSSDVSDKSPNILANKTKKLDMSEIESPLLLRPEKMAEDIVLGKGQSSKADGDLIDLISSCESSKSQNSPRLRRRSSQTRGTKSQESPRNGVGVKPVSSLKPKRLQGQVIVDRNENGTVRTSNKMKQATLSQVFGNSPLENVIASKEDADVQKAIELSLREAEISNVNPEAKENSPPFKRPTTPRKSKTVAKQKLKSPGRRSKSKVPFHPTETSVLLSPGGSEPPSSQYSTEFNRSVDPAIQLSELCHDSEERNGEVFELSLASVSDFQDEDLQQNAPAFDPKTSTCIDFDVDSHSIPCSYKFGGSKRLKQRRAKSTDKDDEVTFLNDEAEKEKESELPDLKEGDDAAQPESIMEDSFDRRPKPKEAEFAHVNVVRKQNERRKLTAYDCKECFDYYSGMGLKPEEIKQRMQDCSKHRAAYCPPSTPEHFWDIGIEDTIECEERGYLQKEDKAEDRPRYRRKRQLKKMFKSKTEEEEAKTDDKTRDGEGSVSDIDI